MSLLKDIATLGQLPALLRLKKGMTPRPEDVKDCFGARVEANAANLGTQSAIVCEGKELNWIEFNGLSNQYANAFKAQRVLFSEKGPISASSNFVLSQRLEVDADTCARPRVSE